VVDEMGGDNVGWSVTQKAQREGRRSWCGGRKRRKARLLYAEGQATLVDRVRGKEMAVQWKRIAPLE